MTQSQWIAFARIVSSWPHITSLFVANSRSDTEDDLIRRFRAWLADCNVSVTGVLAWSMPRETLVEVAVVVHRYAFVMDHDDD